MTSYYVSFTIFVIIAYLIVTDASVARFVVLMSKIVKLNYEKAKWWVRYSPSNPIVRYFIWRRSWKLAKELENEFLKANRQKDQVESGSNSN